MKNFGYILTLLSVHFMALNTVDLVFDYSSPEICRVFR